jgi:hypothetical protein
MAIYSDDVNGDDVYVCEESKLMGQMVKLARQVRQVTQVIQYLLAEELFVVIHFRSWCAHYHFDLIHCHY